MGKSEKQKENDGNGSGDGAKRGSATHARRVTIVFVLLSFVGMYFLSGCLVSLGTPLVCKVEPKTWIIEGGGGLVISGFHETWGWGGYAYVGRGLGEHFEIGILPYGYILADYNYAGALFVPVKWDPFAYERPFHWIFFLGPVLYYTYLDTFSEFGLGGTIGTGWSYFAGGVGELYGSTSTLIYPGDYGAYVPLTFELGLRFHITDRFNLGLNVIYTGYFGAGLGVTVGTVL